MQSEIWVQRKSFLRSFDVTKIKKGLTWFEMQHHTILGKHSDLKLIKKLSPSQFASIMIIVKDSKDRNKYTEAHTYLILKVVEAIGKSIKDEQQKCVNRG